jgi:hypothetical protein
LGQWLSGLPSLALAVIPLSLVALRVIRVAHGNYTTELALIQQSKTLDVLFGSLAPVVPYLVMYLAAGISLLAWERIRSQRTHVRTTAAGTNERDDGPSLNVTWVYLAAAVMIVIVVAGTTSWGELLFAAVAVALAFGAGVVLFALLVRVTEGKGVAVSTLRNWKWPPTVFVGALLAFTIFQLGFDDSMWSPPQVVAIAGSKQIVYVLDQTDRSVLAMRASDRLLIRFPPDDLNSSVACYEAHGTSGIENRLRRWPSVLQLFGFEPEHRQTTCEQLLKP